jgi:hypothetical protein
MSTAAGRAAVARAKARLRPLREPDEWPPAADAFASASPAAVTADSGGGGCATAPPPVAVVEAADGLAPAEFQARFEATGTPALLRGLLARWPALPVAAGGAGGARGWTVEGLAARLGQQQVQCGDDEHGEVVTLPFAAFVHDYLRAGADRNPMILFDSLLLQTGGGAEASARRMEAERIPRRPVPRPGPGPLPPLQADFVVPAIFGADDYLGTLGELERPPYRWFLLAPARSGSSVHTDPMGTQAWNALLAGAKRWVMFDPETPAALLQPWAGRSKHLAPACDSAAARAAAAEAGGVAMGESDDYWQDLWGWFVEDLPLIRVRVAAHFEARPRAGVGLGEWWCRDFVQRAGEVVYVPPLWHHAVLNLSETVCATQNYCSRTNLALCYQMATGFAGPGAPPLPGAGAMDGAAVAGPGLDAASARLWRAAMLEADPAAVAAHMPAEWLPAVGGAAGASAVAVAAEDSAPDGRCVDLRGRRYDVTELCARRTAATLRGMEYLAGALREDDRAPLYAIGGDAAGIFFEIWSNSADPNVRARSGAHAEELIRALTVRWLAEPAVPGGADLDGFHERIFLLRCAHEMGLGCGRLLAAVDRAWAQHGFADTAVLFGLAEAELPGVPTGEWLVLLARILLMEYMAVVCFPGRWPLQWGLGAALRALRAHPLASAADGDPYRFHDAFYLATHIGYALSAYSAVRAPLERLVPWLDSYVRHSFRHYMAVWERNDARGLGCADPGAEYVDTDALGEVLDTLRGTGATEATDPCLCEGTAFLLRVQLADGSFPVTCADAGSAWSATSPYDRLHSSWVCTQSLCDRDWGLARATGWTSHGP